jgi:hypothetical protein
VNKFLAVNEPLNYFELANTPEEAVRKLNLAIGDDGWDAPKFSDIDVYEIQRKGRAKISVEWVSE